MSREARAPRSKFVVWRRFTTRWADNDAYGHVNNTVFYQWFDSAVNSWLVDERLLNIESGDLIALVAETRCTYAAPLAFPGEVEVGLSVAALGRSSVHYRIGVFGDGEELAAAQGEFVHVLVDRTSRTPVEMPSDWRRALEAIRPD